MKFKFGDIVNDITCMHDDDNAVVVGYRDDGMPMLVWEQRPKQVSIGTWPDEHLAKIVVAPDK